MRRTANCGGIGRERWGESERGKGKMGRIGEGEMRGEATRATAEGKDRENRRGGDAGRGDKSNSMRERAQGTEGREQWIGTEAEGKDGENRRGATWRRQQDQDVWAGLYLPIDRHINNSTALSRKTLHDMQKRRITLLPAKATHGKLNINV